MTVAWVHLSSLLLDRGRLAEAVEAMEEARELGVASEALLDQLAVTLVSVGEADRALEILGPPSADSEPTSAANARALALAQLGRLDEAEEVLQQITGSGAPDANTWENLSYVAIRRGRWVDAEKHAREALTLRPDFWTSWNNLGIALYNQERPDEAIAAWQRGLESRPRDADLLFNLGMVEATSGRESAARVHLEAFLEVATGAVYEERRAQAAGVLEGMG